jgi:hypothetical protein
MFAKFHTGNLGITANATTFISAVHGFANIDTLRERRKLMTFPPIKYEGMALKVESGYKWNSEQKCYTLPLAVADIPVIKLGQNILEIHKMK